MPRIPEEDIERIKSRTDLLALVRSRGIELAKHGSKDWIGRCPFHEDNATPNLIVSPDKGLYHCMACGAAGNVIQFVERFDGVSFRHAFEVLNEGKGFESNQPLKTSTVRKLPNPLEPSAEDAELLNQVVSYYQERLTHNPAAQAYLVSRGLDDDALAKRFHIGFADRTLGLRIENKNRKQGADLRQRLQELGVFRKDSGHEHFNGSLVFPVYQSECISEIYGRKITRNLRKGTPLHLYLPGPHRGIFNPAALDQRELILAESIIDALTFIRHGMESATCIYGTEGFTDELFTSIKARGIESVRLAYDADEAGERAAHRDAEKLQAVGVECFRIKLPWGEDPNSYALNQGAEALRRAVRSAEWLGTPSTTLPLAAKSLAAKEETVEEPLPQPISPAIELVASPSGEYHELTLGNRIYRIGGLEKNQGLAALKITLRLWCNDLFHVDQLDLCRDLDRRRFFERAADETHLEPELIKRDLGKLLLACEQAQEQRLEALMAPNDEAEPHVMNEEEHAEALALLQDPNLLQRLTEAFDEAGIVGEETNKLAAYLAATSRLLDKPLAVIIQSTSAAGKTTLMEAVLRFFPAETQIKYSAMTGQSLYYLGEKNLQHKILAIVEEEGAEKASYALKLLQSEGELTIASTGKDPQTGRMQTEEYHVEGPVAIVLTTTSIDIDEELMNRCLILSVDETQAQTERIHALQRQARTLEGLRQKKRREAILTKLTNAQRLLRPLEIINPYADQLTFTSQRTRTRRDHEKYLTLIEAITLLHQHQRVLETDPDAGEFIRTTIEDIEAANRLAPEVLGRSLDELPPQTRSMLDELKALVLERCEQQAIDQDKCRFTRREVRERTGWSLTQVRVHLERLVEMEYLAIRHGRNGAAYLYELLIDARQPAEQCSIGLIDLRQQPDGRKRNLTRSGAHDPAKVKALETSSLSTT